MSYLTIDPSRTVSSASIPFQKSFQMEEIFVNGKFDWEKLLNFFDREGRLKKSIISEIIKKSKKILEMEPNIINLEGKFVVFGDIHGQYYDLQNLLKKNLSDFHEKDGKKFVFLGDYVDRGCFSIEVMITLLILKLNTPRKVTLLRGNHECQQMTTHHSFRAQCINKYDQSIYYQFLELFQYLPYAAILNSSFLCLHGGISQNLMYLQKVRRINRISEIPDQGDLCDLVWADPAEVQSFQFDKNNQIENKVRGCSYVFGSNLTKKFLKNNKLKCIIRGHQAQLQGYKFFHWKGLQEFPLVMTIFSAPNYCDFYNNKGSILYLNQNKLQIVQYNQVSHPYYLPQFMDVFQWSIPFVTQKVSQVFCSLLNQQQVNVDESIDFNLIKKFEAIQIILNIQKEMVQKNKNSTFFDGRNLDMLLSQDKEVQEYLQDKLFDSKNTDEDFKTRKSIDLKNQKKPETGSPTKSSPTKDSPPKLKK